MSEDVKIAAMEIIAPKELGEGALLFHRMSAREELGRLSEYRLELLSPNSAIPLDLILGQNVTVKLRLSDESDHYRYFNGFVSRFSNGGTYGRFFRYSATVRPWVWFLTRTADCRIFQEKTVKEIIEDVFADHSGFGGHEFDLTGTYGARTYCVQYRESDFNFVSRLLEHEGICYYFRHEEGSHKVILTDTKHYPHAGFETLRFIAPEHFARTHDDHISSWDVAREVQPGAYAQTDYDFQKPNLSLRTKQLLTRSYAPSEYEVFDYPGTYLLLGDGNQLSKVRIEEYGSQFELAEATTNCREVSVGSLFALAECYREDQDGQHLVIAANYDLEYSDYEGMPGEGGSSYTCRFVAMSTATQQQFRPQRLTPRPFVQGPQTAVVVGPAGNEIHTDEHGRVKVQFHWDRRGKNDDKSSCWIRVSHPWAGEGWGAVAIPRIGQEVIVDFLEGDPDQPIITGRVYNGVRVPPYPLPAGAVVSGIKSQTHRGSGYNELSMDDTAGKEKITIHGQYDMNTTVEHDQTNTIGNDQTDTVKNNRKTEITVDDTEKVGSNQKIEIGADQTLKVGANQKIDVTSDQTVTIGANRSVTVGADDEISAKSNMKHSAGSELAFSAGTDLKADAGMNVKISGGVNVEIAAGTILKLTASGSSIEIGPSGVTISSASLVSVSGVTIKLN
jgi:type VI secretion system secreted protein VgrG